MLTPTLRIVASGFFQLRRSVTAAEASASLLTSCIDCPRVLVEETPNRLAHLGAYLRLTTQVGCIVLSEAVYPPLLEEGPERTSIHVSHRHHRRIHDARGGEPVHVVATVGVEAQMSHGHRRDTE